MSEREIWLAAAKCCGVTIAAVSVVTSIVAVAFWTAVGVIWVNDERERNRPIWTDEARWDR